MVMSNLMRRVKVTNQEVMAFQDIWAQATSVTPKRIIKPSLCIYRGHMESAIESKTLKDIFTEKATRLHSKKIFQANKSWTCPKIVKELATTTLLSSWRMKRTSTQIWSKTPPI
jgi:hypothetical protein